MSYPANYNIKLFIGNKRRWRFYPKDTDDVAIDMTGMRAVFYAGPSKDDYVIRAASDDESPKCTISEDGTYIQMLVSTTDSRLFPANGTKYELELRSEDDEDQQTLFYGLVLAKLWINDDAH